MGRCGCASVDTCGCRFAGTSHIAAAGIGSEENPFLLNFAPGFLPVIQTTRAGRAALEATIDAGQVIYEQDSTQIWVWTGAQWRPPTWGHESPQTVFGNPIVAGLGGPTTTQTLVVPDPGYSYALVASAAVKASGGNAGDIWVARIKDGTTGVIHAEVTDEVLPGGSFQAVIPPTVWATAGGNSTPIQVQVEPAVAGAPINVLGSAGTYCTYLRVAT